DLLRERGADVLAHLDLPGEDGDLAVLVDVEPGGEVLRQLLSAARAAGFLRLDDGDAARRREDDEQSAAEELQEASAVDVEPVEDRDLVLRKLGGRWPPLPPALSRRERGIHRDALSKRFPRPPQGGALHPGRPPA